MDKSVNQMYINSAQPVKTNNHEYGVRIVPKFRGDHQPFNANVGDFVINQPQNQGTEQLKIQHGQVVSLNDYNQVLKANQKPELSQATLADAYQNKRAVADATQNVAVAAPLSSNGTLQLNHLQTPVPGFNYQQVQKPLEDHSQAAHSNVHALELMDANQAKSIKQDPKYQFSQYDDKVVDALPKSYFQKHPLPIGQTMDNPMVKQMLYNAHTMVMQDTREKTNQAVANAISNNGGSLLNHNNDSARPKPKHQHQISADQLLDPMEFIKNGGMAAPQAPQSDNPIGDQTAATTPINERSQKADNQSLNNAFNQEFGQAIQQRYLDHQRLNDTDTDAASVFEDDYEPKDLSDAESTLAFDKKKQKLGYKTSDKRLDYLTKLLNNRQAITEHNDETLASDDDKEVDQRAGSEAAKEARQEKRHRLLQQKSEKKKQKQLEMYADSIYAMKYHDDHGNARYRYNAILHERPSANQPNNPYINNAKYLGLDNQMQTAHEMPLSKSTVDNIMHANGREPFSTQQVDRSIQKGQAITGKNDNIAFTGELSASKNGPQLKADSIQPTAKEFSYQKEIAPLAKTVAKTVQTEQSTPQPEKLSQGLHKVANPKPRKFSSSDLINPMHMNPSVKAANASLNAALDAALANPMASLSTSTTKTKQRSLEAN